MQISTVVLVVGRVVGREVVDQEDQVCSKDPEETWMMCYASSAERKVTMLITVITRTAQGIGVDWSDKGGTVVIMIRLWIGGRSLLNFATCTDFVS